MNIKQSPIVICLLILLFSGCKERPSDNTYLPFLEGTWIMSGSNTPEKRFVEEWTLESDSALTGNGYLLNTTTGDRFNTEQLWLDLDHTGWTYYAMPVNNEAKTAFKASQSDEYILMFENPEHDFPQYIRYERIAADSLLVTIGDTATSKSWKMVRYP